MNSVIYDLQFGLGLKYSTIHALIHLTDKKRDELDSGITYNYNHWVASRSTQFFILPRLIKWVPGISGILVLKSKLPPCSGFVALTLRHESHP